MNLEKAVTQVDRVDNGIASASIYIREGDEIHTDKRVWTVDKVGVKDEIVLHEESSGEAKIVTRSWIMQKSYSSDFFKVCRRTIAE